MCTCVSHLLFTSKEHKLAQHDEVEFSVQNVRHLYMYCMCRHVRIS